MTAPSTTQSGYVYALINPSMPGLVKVGRTARAVDARVFELSSATAVPTPFEIVFDVFVEDCVAGEASVHRALSTRGYRLTANREFFKAPVREVIELMLALPRGGPGGGAVDGSAATYRAHDTLLAAATSFGARRPTITAADLMQEFHVGFRHADALLGQMVMTGVATHATTIGQYSVRAVTGAARVQRAVRGLLPHLNHPEIAAIFVVAGATHGLPHAPLRTFLGAVVAGGGSRATAVPGPDGDGQVRHSDRFRCARDRPLLGVQRRGESLRGSED
jgi:T5orf172 domain